MFAEASVSGVSTVVHFSFLSFSHTGFTMICRRIRQLFLHYCPAFVWETDVKRVVQITQLVNGCKQNSAQVSTFQHFALARRLALFLPKDGYFQRTNAAPASPTINTI